MPRQSGDGSERAPDDRAAKGRARRQRGRYGASIERTKEGKPPITPASSPLKDVFFDFDRYDLSDDARTFFAAMRSG